MSLASEASKLITNKYFLYFMVFLASTNILGYLVTNKMNAVIFFALVSLLTYQFSKNMSVILLVAIIATNFLMANKRIREGLENESTTSTSQTTSATPTTSVTAGTWTNLHIDMVKGDPGITGTRTAVLDLYQWGTTTAPTLFPSGTSTYYWSTGQFTDPATLNSWTQTPASPTAVELL